MAGGFEAETLKWGKRKATISNNARVRFPGGSSFQTGQDYGISQAWQSEGIMRRRWRWGGWADGGVRSALRSCSLDGSSLAAQ
jgi:hypothetical protein